jgi:hypothetical protein
MEIAFADGYVAPISGPIMMETNDGYAIKDPGNRRALVAFALPAAGAGIGALIGYAAGSAGSTQSTTLPPGCIGGPPFCLSMSTPVLGTKGRDAIIGAGVGGAIGALASMGLLFSSHNFFIDVGAAGRDDASEARLLGPKRSGCRGQAIGRTSGSGAADSSPCNGASAA